MKIKSKEPPKKEGPYRPPDKDRRTYAAYVRAQLAMGESTNYMYK